MSISFSRLTKAEYEALETKVANRIYFISDSGEQFLDGLPYDGEDNRDYFYMENRDASASHALQVVQTDLSKFVTRDFEWSTDRRTWTKVSFDGTTGIGAIATVPSGARVYVRGDNETVGNNLDTSGVRFESDGPFAVGGNIMSLMDKACLKTDLDDAKSTTGFQDFARVFKDSLNLVDASDLRLPATEIRASAAYNQLFRNCSALAKGPKVLPATEIPAPTNGMISYAYYRMFSGCSALSEAPDIRLEKLLDDSTRGRTMENMFRDATALSSVVAHFSGWVALNTNNWLQNTAATGVFKCPSALDTSVRDASHIPAGWTVTYTDVEAGKTIPSATSSDAGKVLTVDTNGDAEWAEAQGIDPLDYLHFTAMQPNSTVRLDKSSSDLADVNLEYSTDKNTWTAYTWSGTTGATVTLANIGDKVWFRGNNVSFSTSTSLYFQFKLTASTGVSGNIMSLLDKTCQSVVLPVSYCFYRLFYEQYYLLSAEGLNLPATTLTTYCYKQMFNRSQIDGAPYLPAKVIPNDAYSEMFRDCKPLKHAFDFPGCCKLGQRSCEYMFSGTSLEEAPNINLAFNGAANYGLQYMFANCRGLEEPPSLFCLTMNGTSTVNAFNIATGLCEYMFSGCISLKKPMRICFPNLDYQDVPNGTLSRGNAIMGYLGMYDGCTSLMEFPEFPTFEAGRGDQNNELMEMFKGCTSFPECFAMPHYSTGGDQGSDGSARGWCPGFYQNMFEGVTSLRRVSFPDKFYLNTQDDRYTRSNILSGAFKNCSSLKYVKATFPAWGSETTIEYTTDWLYGVSSTGVFDCPVGLDTSTRDASHVPSGWTVCHNDYDASLEPASFAIPAASTAQLLLPPTVFSHAPSAATVYTLWHDPDKAVETVRIVVDMTATNAVSFQDENGVAIPSGTWAVGSEVEFTCTYANGGWAVVGDDGSKGASQADVQSMIADALTMH